MCKVSRGSEDHLVQGLADFGSFSQKMPLKLLKNGNKTVFKNNKPTFHYSWMKSIELLIIKS